MSYNIGDYVTVTSMPGCAAEGYGIPEQEWRNMVGKTYKVCSHDGYGALQLEGSNPTGNGAADPKGWYVPEKYLLPANALTSAPQQGMGYTQMYHASQPVTESLHSIDTTEQVPELIQRRRELRKLLGGH